MLTNILNELKTEQAAGNKMAEELVERIDAHIRDLETLKLWVIDRGAARWMSLELLLNGEESGESEPLADDVGSARHISIEKETKPNVTDDDSR